MRSWAVLLSVLAAACATPEPPPVTPPPAVTLEPEAAKPPPPPAERRPNAVLKHLANRDLKPIPTRPLNAKTTCAFRDQMGYGGRLNLDVKNAAVKRFDAQVNIPKRGTCRFQLRDFEQTQTAPVQLTSNQTACKVNMWEQADQVTVAFRDCRAECSGDSVDYLWPILVDNRKGRCS
jgi:hypothetical protein